MGVWWWWDYCARRGRYMGLGLGLGLRLGKLGPWRDGGWELDTGSWQLEAGRSDTGGKGESGYSGWSSQRRDTVRGRGTRRRAETGEEQEKMEKVEKDK